jgi:DNA-binding GntR family transcriptional regulator
VPGARAHGRLAPVDGGGRLVRIKTSDAVAERILDMLFAGELRPGDRIDLDAIAEQLGVSRAPVREALLALQRDGIVEMPFHRGAFVARFDAGTIREAFELYALLNALTSTRVARSRDPRVIAELERAADEVDRATGIEEFEPAAREFRRIINVAAGGPHLRALLRTFGGLLPVASRLSMDRSLAEERALVQRELRAIRSGDAERAGAAAIEHIRLLGDYAAQTLRARGVIGDDDPVDGEDAELLRVLRALDRSAE